MYPCSYKQLALAVCIMMALLASAICPASCTLLQNPLFPHSYNFGPFNIPSFSGTTAPPGTIAVSMQDKGKTIEAGQGDTLKVTLLETDTHQTWRYAGGDNAVYVDEALLESYPMQHRFTLKVVSSGPVRFNMVDDRNGTIIEEFTLYLAIKTPKNSPIKRFSPGLDLRSSFKWPFK